jgi:amino acid adenylation domain-containing protein
MKDIAGLAGKLSSKKRELLELLLKEKERKREEGGASGARGKISIPRRTGEAPPPASFAQQRLWFIDQLEPGSPAYNIPAAVRLVGALDAAVLKRAVDEIVQRHEDLRTSFGAQGGRPFQAIAPDLALPLPLEDLSGGDDPAALARRRVMEEAERPFDLGRGPLLRLTLLRLGADDHVLLLIIHHIIADVWSIGVFFREVAAFYKAHAADAAGESSPLPELPVQYGDFAVWQQAWLAGDGPREQLAFWKRQLTGAPAILDLPTDRPRPPLQTFNGARRPLLVDLALTETLQELSQREDASMFMTLQAGLAMLLCRYANQEEVLTGTPMANRTRVELERLIGFFVNTLVVRTDLTGDPSFRALLARVRETTLGVYAHHDLPLEKILEELQPERDLSRNPLFQVVFAFQNAPMPPLVAPGLTLSPFEIEERTSRFDLELDLRDTGVGFGGWIGYNTDLFEAATVERMTRHYRALLAAAAAEPDRRLSELSLLSAAERVELLVEKNQTATDYPRKAAIHALFAAQAAASPEALAVLAQEGRLTYRQLDRRANHLAHRLRQAGVGPESLVGIAAERSLAGIVGLLAILKAGGAYLPLDPAYPAERLAFMIGDAGASVILAQSDLVAALPTGGATVVTLADEEEERDDPPAVWTDPESLAYVTYTSGSTGRPKGVAVPHRAVVRLVRGTGYARFDAAEVFLQFAPVAFDASTFEIWGALLNGSRLAVHPPGTPSVAELGRFLAESGCTTAWLTAGLFHEVMDSAPDSLRGLKQLLAGGDALSLPHVRRALTELGCTVINGYGPTEGTTFTCCNPLNAFDLDRLTASVPIGRPIANTRVYILDPHGNPAPAGVAGELHIGGDGLARGYLKRPELTALRFVPSPFGEASGVAGERLYATGDLVRWIAAQPAGEIEFLRRIDHQVKVRGFRIELGEVEAALTGHPAIAQAVVTARQDAPGDKRLVAYLVAREEPAPTVSELRGFLAERLPEYMVPSLFVPLPGLPLTANGKVDRRALPAPGGERPELDAEFVAPRTPVERQLAEIWCAVLGVERVGVHDDFFELGGQSLLATQIVSRLREVCGVEIPLRSLFQQPTLAGLALAVEAARFGGQAAQGAPIVALPRDGHELPLSFAQERLWFIDQLVPGLAAYNIPGAVRMRGSLDLAALEASFTEILRRHEVLRTTFTAATAAETAGRPVALIGSPYPYPVPLVDLSALPEPAREPEARRLANGAAGEPFDLSRGPLLRALILRLAPRDHLMALILHHIVYDMWSREVFLGELGVLYNAFATGRPSPLRDLDIQYADFAHWQRQWLTGEVLAEQLAYWRRQLAAVPTALELPTDRPRPAVQTFRGTRRFLHLSPERTAALQALAQARGVTLFITLLAAFDVLLLRYTGQDDLPVGSPIANRNRLETEPLMGFFANTLVLRSDLSGGIRFSELLPRVREVALGAYAHQDVAFEQLVHDLQPERDLGRQPLFQVMFNFVQNYMPPALELPDLSLAAEWIHGGQVQFDFTLSMWESDGRLHGALDYSTDLFDPTTMERLLGHFANLTGSAVAHPEERLTALVLLNLAERHQVEREWNDSDARGLNRESFAGLFAAVARSHPQELALITDDPGSERLTYGELDRRAGRAARRLAARGVGPETVVALLAERGADLVTAILAVWQVGGAYLPLDPAHPARRHAQVLTQSGAPLVLVGRELLPALAEAMPEVPPEHRPELLALPDLLAADAPDAPEVEPADVAGSALAYVIYTSGSTGLPKGAMVERRGMVNHLFAKIRDLGLGPRDLVAQTASQCFDISVWQMFAALAVGGRVRVFPDEVAHDPARLLDRVDAEEVTVLEVVPSLARAMLDEIDSRHAANTAAAPAFEKLRFLVPTGEALPPDLCRRWLARYSGAPMVNAYGPTECSDDVTHALLREPTSPGAARVPIGRPVANLRLHVLDVGGETAPIGVVGELCVGGVGVGRGYLNDPLRTAAVFVPNPSSASPGARLYRTGDLARWLVSGELDFLGRLDHQVKVRGFRIELGEIEAALLDHPNVREAVVLAPSSGRDASDRTLVAYLVTEGDPGDPETGDRELRDALRQRLPEYMLPSAFVRLPALPLTENGKLDRRALLDLGGAEPAPREAYVAPRTPIEEEVAAIWSTVLGRERVGVLDNFFEIGGHSLLVTQVVSRLRGGLGVELPLRALFEAPTVAGLAERIATVLWARGAAQGVHAVENDPVGVAVGEEEGEL